jgi:hypothetical protein
MAEEEEKRRKKKKKEGEGGGGESVGANGNDTRVRRKLGWKLRCRQMLV